MKLKLYLMIAAMIFFPVAAFANQCYKPAAHAKPCHDCETMLRNINPDLRTSLEVLVGTGGTNESNGNITTFGATLTWPIWTDVSFVAKYDHYNLQWDRNYNYMHDIATPIDFESNVYSFGAKLYLP